MVKHPQLTETPNVNIQTIIDGETPTDIQTIIVGETPQILKL